MATTNSTSPNTQGESAPVIDRDTASKFNPLIGINAGETMERCERAVSDIGYVISGADEIGLNVDTQNMFRLFEVACIALRYEIKSLQQGAQA